MFDIADSLLFHGFDVVVDAWNLHPHDRKRWEDMAAFNPDRVPVWLSIDTPV